MRAVRLALAGLTLAALALVPIAGAQAKPCGDGGVPPGNSEIDQYLETLPSGCGNQGTNPTGGSDSGADAIPAATAAELEEGSLGRAVLAISESTSPPRSAGDADGEPKSGSAASDASTELSAASKEDVGNSPLSAVVDALGGDAGGGLWLPVILCLLLIGAFAYFLRARRSG